jgi:FixJ family two-component response regulator
MLRRQVTVAILDDDPSMLRATKELLEAYGVSTLLFSSAEEFLDSDAVAKVDCLLLDIQLDGVCGIELRNQLNASGLALPIIFMTGLDSEIIHAHALQAGCVAYLRKPFLARELFEGIERATA